jgi:2-C-methyl-D-erythritol 4-phosphate cytidylyltransferase
MKAVAIVLASGAGRRYGSEFVPKHLTEILGVPIVVWTIRAAFQSGLFSVMAVVVRKEDISATEILIEKYFGDQREYVRVTEGSDVRIQSFFRGLDDLKKTHLLINDTIIALLDANRPFVPMSQFQDLFRAALEFGCSCPARAVVNGIGRAIAGHIVEVPDKSSYMEFVTPEFMRYSALEMALARHPGDLACLVEYALAVGIQPAAIDASALNVKLTYAEDVVYLQGLARKHQLLVPSISAGRKGDDKV